MAKPKEGEILDIGDDWELLFPGEYLRGVDIGNTRPTVKITRMYRKRIRGKVHPVAELENTERKWRINFTNGLCLKEMFGKSPRKWVNRLVTLCSEMVKAFGRPPAPAIRVYGSPELTKEIEVFKDMQEFGEIRRTLEPVKRNGTPPTSHTGGQGGA